jgi:ribosomal protein S18 acetylase RimI-like enzyme
VAFGPVLLRKLIDYLRGRGTTEVVGEALSDNERLLGLVRRFGFDITPAPAQAPCRFGCA